MKFDEISAESSKNKSKFRKYKSTIVSILVFIVVLVLFFTLYNYVFKKNVGDDNKDVSITLKKDDILIRSLYSKVHSFNEKDPFWIYKNETGRLVYNMTEATKMSLVYINLKISDFGEITCDKVPVSISGYDGYNCSDKTKIIKLDSIDRVYKELFGKNANVNVSSTIRIDPYNSGIYVYLKEIDSYVLYLKGVDVTDSDFNYSYEIVDIDSSDNEIKIHEEVTNNNLEANNKSKNIYTFKLDDYGIYTYYSKE